MVPKKMGVLFLAHLIIKHYLLREKVIMEELKEKHYLLNIRKIMIIQILKNVLLLYHKSKINMPNTIYLMKIQFIQKKLILTISLI